MKEKIGCPCCVGLGIIESLSGIEETKCGYCDGTGLIDIETKQTNHERIYAINKGDDVMRIKPMNITITRADEMINLLIDVINEQQIEIQNLKEMVLQLYKEKEQPKEE